MQGLVDGRSGQMMEAGWKMTGKERLVCPGTYALKRLTKVFNCVCDNNGILGD